jgi:hypothetical protein
MPAVKESDLRRSLEGQGFIVEDKADGSGWTVKAPDKGANGRRTNPSGIVQIHTTSLGKEKAEWISILGELKKIGFDPDWEPPKKAMPEAPSLGEVYNKEPSPDDPDDKWVTYNEAAEIIGLKGGSGVAQRVKAGKLRAVKLPVVLPAFGGGQRQAQAWHVNVKELKASSHLHATVSGRTRTAPVRTRFESTAAGRLSQATTQARAAIRKIERGFEELQEAMKVIDDESMGALNELRDVKQRQKDIEGLLERAVGKL